MTCKLEQAGIKPPTLQLVDDMPTTWATATCSVAVKEAYVIRAQGLFFVDIPEKKLQNHYSFPFLVIQNTF